MNLMDKIKELLEEKGTEFEQVDDRIININEELRIEIFTQYIELYYYEEDDYDICKGSDIEILEYLKDCLDRGHY